MAIYSDINLAYSPGRSPVVQDEAAVLQALELLFLTKPGERLFRPKVGLDLESYLFEPADSATVLSVRSAVDRALGEQEPRVRLDPDFEVEVKEDTIEVELRFTIPRIEEMRKFVSRVFVVSHRTP